MRMLIQFWSGNINGRDHFGELNIDGSMVLRLILDK
jgi:hypothetical protein